MAKIPSYMGPTSSCGVHRNPELCVMSCSCTTHAGTTYLIRGNFETNYANLLRLNVLYAKLHACAVPIKLHSQRPFSYVQYYFPTIGFTIVIRKG